MKTYITTDTHFNHEAIKEYCGRPDNYEQLIQNSLKNLKPNHMLIHLGDIAWHKDKAIHEKYIMPLKCKKILVIGNHDSKSYNWYMRHGWDFVCDSFTMEKHGLTIVFTHEPKAWDGYFDVNIHGHLHNSQHHLENELKGIYRHGQYLVCIEDLKYKLKPLDEILGEVKRNKDKMC